MNDYQGEEKKKGVELTYDEALAVVDLLSRLPYKDVHIVLPMVVTRLAASQKEPEPLIVTN